MAGQSGSGQSGNGIAGTTRRPHVWRPAAHPASARTLLLLHGTGADEHDLLSLGRALDPTANLLSPRGLVVAEGMSRFFLRYPDGRFDEAGIVANANQLAEFLASAAFEYGFDASKVWAVGFSNGANAAGSLLLLHPESVVGIAAFGTTKSFVNPPKVQPNLTGKAVFIANGAIDDYSPADKTDAMVREFRSYGAEVELMMHKGGHSISHEHVKRIASAIQASI
jgi:phospholipase/carboxylesterase